MSQLKQLLDQIDHIKNQDSSCLPESFLNETDLKNMYSAITSQPAPKYRETDLEPAPGNHFPKPEDLDHLVSHFFSQLDFSRHTLHPVELAAMAYKRIVDMAPFEEKNEVLAQALMDRILKACGYPRPLQPLYLTDGYTEALTSSRKRRDMDIFSEFAAAAVLSSADH